MALQDEALASLCGYMPEYPIQSGRDHNSGTPSEKESLPSAHIVPINPLRNPYMVPKYEYYGAHQCGYVD